MIKKQVWGLRRPISPEELEIYRAELVGALDDLEALGFTFYMLNSYKKTVLVIKQRRGLRHEVKEWI